MTARTYNALFVCTGNAARSILAEGLMNHAGQGRFKAWSAGSYPTGVVHPLALAALAQFRIPTDGFRSKSWNEFTTAGAPALDFVITVCDQAAGEACPVWPGKPVTANWGVHDPAAFNGPEDKKAAVFRDTALVLKRRIDLMLALPMAALDRLSLQHAMRDIGNR
jgi:protein-tyrosine-phosphatase